MDGSSGTLDDSISAASASDVQDRLSALELRVQQQEDELTVMKAALADVLRRLSLPEGPVPGRKTPSKGQSMLREAYSMSCIANGSSVGHKLGHRNGSSVSLIRKETLSSAAKSKGDSLRNGISVAHLHFSGKFYSSPLPLISPSLLFLNACVGFGGCSSRKRGSRMERSKSSTWERAEESRGKLVKAASTSKLLAKGTKNGDHIKMFIRGRPITMSIPSSVENYEDICVELPSETLKLEWVYGYRGRDCRANIHLLPTGEVVYFIASVVVLFNYEERTQRHYLGHTDCVKCLAVHPDKIRIATGQTAGMDKDGRPLQPHVRVWDSVSLSTLQVIGLGTFERGVATLAFSKADSGSHLSVIDDSTEHTLTVWDWQKKSRIAEIKTTNETVLAVDFHPTDTSTIVTCGKSHVFFWTWNCSSLVRKQGIFGKYEKPKFVQCVAFLPSGNILTGDSGGILLVWSRSTAMDLAPGKGPKVNMFQISHQIKAHDGSLFTMCQIRNGMLLTGGGKDHRIILWDHDLNPERDIEVPDQYGAIRALAEGKGDEFFVGTSRNFILRGTFNDGFLAEVQAHTDELWGLASHPFKHLFLTCAQDRQVFLWNAVDHCLEWTKLLDEPGHCADFHPGGAVVAIGTHSGKWYALDAETRDLVAIHTDGSEQLSVIRYSTDGALLAVGSHDNFIYIYTVWEKGRRYSRHGKCAGHSSYITHLDWSTDSTCIMSNSGDYEILYWDIPKGCTLIRNRSQCKDVDWATYTCVLGFQVFGVWPEGSDGTDINALVRSHNRKILALADDFCKVHLYQYPCSRPKAPSHKYSAHSSHVTNVSFLYDDGHLVTTGGKDTSVIQWCVVEKNHSLVLGEGLTLGLGEGVTQRPSHWGGTSHTESTQQRSLVIPTKPRPNEQHKLSPDTPPTSGSTLSAEDSLEQRSDDTATPVDEHAPSLPL
uniref:Echinoderm microtubule-associated protein-like 4 n=1 Tax=Scleropages formosus TaxID=113540 RepID=A0A8D0CGS8_SCLFO